MTSVTESSGTVTSAGGKDHRDGVNSAVGGGGPLANSTENGGDLDILNFSVSDGGLETLEPVEVS